MPIPKNLRLSMLFVLILVATSVVPVSAGSGDSNGSAVSDAVLSGAACRAVQWLHGQQKPDGGWGVISTSSAAVTADVIYVLGLLREDVDGPSWTTSTGKDPLDALQTLTIPKWVQADPGQAGKVTRAVALAGANPRSFGGLDLVATIQGFYDPETGLYHSALLFRHSVAIEGLLLSGVKVPQAALDALLSEQLPDGGWFWSTDGTRADVDMTGRALQVLGAARVAAPAAYSRAADYLAVQQLSDGGWNTGLVTDPTNPPPANGNSTALAVGGLIAIGQDPQAAAFTKNGKGALETLLSFQEPSGAFVYILEPGKQESRVMATVDALATLAPLVSRTMVCQLVYLPMLVLR